MASVIFFVINSLHGLSKDDLRFLACQVENGSQVFFIFNRSRADSPPTIEEKLGAARQQLATYDVFKEAPIYLFNVKEASAFLQNPEANQEEPFAEQSVLNQLLDEIFQTVEAKMSSMIFHFARSLYHFLHTYYLLMSKVVAQKMRGGDPPLRKTSRPSLLRTITGIDDDPIVTQMKEINQEIDTLLGEADKMIAQYKQDLVALFLRVVEDQEPKLLIEARQMTTKVPFNKDEKTWLQRIMGRLGTPMSPFEEEICRALLDRFLAEYSRV